MADPVRLTGLRAVAHQYDAILCDVWGVLHDGLTVHPGVVEALTEFQAHAPVVLITNAPRPAQPILQQKGTQRLHLLVTSLGERLR